MVIVAPGMKLLFRHSGYVSVYLFCNHGQETMTYRANDRRKEQGARYLLVCAQMMAAGHPGGPNSRHMPVLCSCLLLLSLLSLRVLCFVELMFCGWFYVFVMHSITAASNPSIAGILEL